MQSLSSTRNWSVQPYVRQTSRLISPILTTFQATRSAGCEFRLLHHATLSVVQLDFRVPFVRALIVTEPTWVLNLIPLSSYSSPDSKLNCHLGQSGPSRLSDRVELETFRDLHQLHSRPFQLHLLIRFAKLHIFAVLPFSCIAFTSLSIPKTGLALNSAMFLAVWEA